MTWPKDGLAVQAINAVPRMIVFHIADLLPDSAHMSLSLATTVTVFKSFGFRSPSVSAEST